MPRGTDAWPAWEQRLSVVEKRQDLVEYRQVRFMRMWIASHLISRTSTPTAPTSPISTGISTPQQPAASRYRRMAQFFKPLLHWAAETFLKWLLPYIVPILMGGWVLLKQYGESLSQFFLGMWHWLVG